MHIHRVLYNWPNEWGSVSGRSSLPPVNLSWYRSGPCGAPQYRSLFTSLITCLQEIVFIQPPGPSLSSRGQVQTVVNQERGGDEETREAQSEETRVQPWGRVLVSPQGTHRTVSLRCFADTETPTRWEKLTVCCPQAHRPLTCWNQKADEADSRLPHHQPIRRISMSWSPTLEPFL